MQWSYCRACGNLTYLRGYGCEVCGLDVRMFYVNDVRFALAEASRGGAAFVVARLLIYLCVGLAAGAVYAAIAMAINVVTP